MKKIFAITLLLAFALDGMAQEVHFDFSVTNSTGYEIYYRITDTDLHQVVVTYPCQHGDSYWWGYDKPEGKLVLMDTINYNGTDYTLVGIDDHAFCGCSGLRGTFVFPESIQTVGAGAFKGCSNLSGNLVFPNVLTRIEDEAFSGCSSFTGKLALPDSIQYVGSQAFLNCSGFRGMMMLPARLSFIGEQAFKGVISINAISIKAKNVPSTAANAFDEIPTWITVNVPYDRKEAYQTAPGWSRFASHTVEKSVWTGNAESWTKGSGTTDDPYLIESAENLAWLAKSINEKLNLVVDTGYSAGGIPIPIYHFYDVYAYQDTCFKMVIDVNLGKGAISWTPIGKYNIINEEEYDGLVSSPHYYQHPINGHYYYYSCFCGQFDGNGHEISKVNYTTVNYMGLFGIISNASICNLTINDLLANPYNGKTTGGVVGKAEKSTLYNCHTSGTIHSNIGGGIVAMAEQTRIEQCTARIKFNNDYQGYSKNIGGIVGILSCDSIGDSHTGVFNCGFIGGMDDAGSIAGGIVATCQSNCEGMGVIHIENCFSRGHMSRVCPDPSTWVESGDFVYGGIAGFVKSIDTLCILNCYSNDTINTVGANGGNHAYYGGGILGLSEVGNTLLIKNCYHVGAINTQHKGGILTQNTNMTIVRNCFFDRSVAPDDGFGLPLDNDYMKTEAFVQQLNNGSSVFRMDTEPYENDGYPVFGTDGLIFVGAEWYYQIQNEEGGITYQHLQCVGDTTIGNKRPKVIVRTNTIYDKRTVTIVTHEYVYEENGVVYWWNKTLGRFTILYDFAAEVGDEWTIEVDNGTITTKVYESEMQYIDGIPYKKLTIADPNDTFNGNLLSTIGHTSSFFPEKMMSQGKGYRVEGLRCYWLDGDLILKTNNDDCDAIYAELHYGVDDPLESGFVIYPNPTDGLLHVETVCATPSTECRIMNLMGQIVMVRSMSNSIIDVSTLLPGMYFLDLGEKTIKFVKQ